MTLVLTMLALAAPTPVDALPAVDTRAHVSYVRRCGRRCHKRRVVRPYNAKLERMAWCESTHRWHLNTGNGFYGGLQFTLSTWHSVGGRGYPHQNSALEQKYRAVRLIKREGYRPWPVCGYR